MESGGENWQGGSGMKKKNPVLAEPGGNEISLCAGDYKLILPEQEGNEAYREAVAAYLRGWSIIPVDPKTKRACLQWRRYQRERVSPGEFQLWRDYEAFAVVTGQLSGVIVLDVDTGGVASLRGFDIPATAIATTPSGGWHYYFEYPQGQKLKTGSNVLGKGSRVDIRAEGGYTVLPGPEGRNWVVAP